MSSYSIFFDRKNSLDDTFDKFKTLNENYDTTTDTSFIIMNNTSIDDTIFTNLDIIGNCKDTCYSDTQCMAYYIDEENNCYSRNSRVTNSEYMNFTPGNSTVNIKKDSNNFNYNEFVNYLMNMNNAISGIIMDMSWNELNYQLINHDISYNIETDKIIMDNSFNLFQQDEKKLRDIISLHKSKIDPVSTNRNYYKYIILFAVMFIMITSFIYFNINNRNEKESNFMLYLVLFLVIFSVLIIYFLK